MNLTRSLFHAETHVMTHTLHDNSHVHHVFNVVRTSLSPRGGTCYVTLHPSMLTHGTTRTLLTRRQRSNVTRPTAENDRIIFHKTFSLIMVAQWFAAAPMATRALDKLLDAACRFCVTMGTDGAILLSFDGSGVMLCHEQHGAPPISPPQCFEHPTNQQLAARRCGSA